MFNKDIAEKAVIANLKISVWSARKTDKAVLKEISEIYKSEEEQGSFSKLLIAKHRLESIKDAATSARKLHNDLTLPWVDGGGRMLPSKDYPEYYSKMQSYQNDFFEAVDNFINIYNDAKSEGSDKLGRIANDKDYPSKEEIKKKYAFEYTFFPVPDNGDFRVTLSSDFIDSLKNNFNQNQLDRFNKAKKAIVDDIIALTSNAIVRLKNTDKSSWFKSATIENLIDYRKDHAMIELLDDQPLLLFLEDIAYVASMHSIQTLRGDDQLRLEVSESLIAQLKKASNDPSLITEPIEILSSDSNLFHSTLDINPDLSDLSDLSDIVISDLTPEPTTESEPTTEPTTEPITNSDQFDAYNFTGIPEGTNPEIMNPFGMLLGQQPQVNEDADVVCDEELSVQTSSHEDEELSVQTSSHEDADVVCDEELSVQTSSHNDEELSVQTSSHEDEELSVQTSSHEDVDVVCDEELSVQTSSHNDEELSVQTSSHEDADVVCDEELSVQTSSHEDADVVCDEELSVQTSSHEDADVVCDEELSVQTLSHEDEELSVKDSSNEDTDFVSDQSQSHEESGIQVSKNYIMNYELSDIDLMYDEVQYYED